MKFLAVIFLAIIFAACSRGDTPISYEETPPEIESDSTAAESATAEPAVIYPPPTLMPEGVRDFPSVRLYAETHPFEMHRTTWHDGEIAVTGANDFFNFEKTDVRIRGRGNSTWVFGSEKRSLRIRFHEPRPMLDSTSVATDWILLANLFDMSLLRNYAVFDFSQRLCGIDFTPFSRFVHLYINGEYLGVYQLTDERDTAYGRVPIEFHPNPRIGEHFLEMDGHVAGPFRANEGAVNYEGIDYFRAHGRVLEPRNVPRRYRLLHVQYMKDFMERAGDIIRSDDFEQIAAIIDLPSFIDFYLANELFKDIDVAQMNIFFTIRGQGDERRLFHGPLWDFDRSSGNTNFWHAPQHIHAAHYNDIFRYMNANERIFSMVRDRWNEIRPVEVVEMIEHIAYVAYFYADAFERNFAAHPHIFDPDYEPEFFVSVPEHTQEIRSFEGQVEFLINWLETRADWLDYFFNERHAERGIHE